MDVEEKDKAMNLISNITHQAINPLNGVIGTLDNVVKGIVPDEKKQQRLTSARSQLEYTVSLLRNLAYFAQYSGADVLAYRKEAENRKCIIPQVIIEAMMFFQEQGSSHDVSIELANPADQNAVKGNPDLLRQVFMNIFDNAVKYSKPGSKVLVKDWIQKRSGDLIISISGQSIGFDPEEDIFSLGVRGRKAREVTSSGSGLGLHICRLIIEKLFNGEITGYTRSDGDVVFEIRLPGAFVVSGGMK